MGPGVGYRAGRVPERIAMAQRHGIEVLDFTAGGAGDDGELARQAPFPLRVSPARWATRPRTRHRTDHRQRIRPGVDGHRGGVRRRRCPRSRQRCRPVWLNAFGVRRARPAPGRAARLCSSMAPLQCRADSDQHLSGLSRADAAKAFIGYTPVEWSPFIPQRRAGGRRRNGETADLLKEAPGPPAFEAAIRHRLLKLTTAGPATDDRLKSFRC